MDEHDSWHVQIQQRCPVEKLLQQRTSSHKQSIAFSSTIYRSSTSRPPTRNSNSNNNNVYCIAQGRSSPVRIFQMVPLFLCHGWIRNAAASVLFAEHTSHVAKTSERDVAKKSAEFLNRRDAPRPVSITTPRSRRSTPTKEEKRRSTRFTTLHIHVHHVIDFVFIPCGFYNALTEWVHDPDASDLDFDSQNDGVSVSKNDTNDILYS